MGFNWAVLVLVLTADLCCSAAPLQLRFNADGKLKILLLTDLHYGDSVSSLDLKTDQVIRTVLHSEPDIDYVQLNGDQVTAFFWMTNLSSGWYEEQWNRLITPVLNAHLPFGVNLGNHDGEADLSRREVVQLAVQSSNLSLTKLGPEGLSGASNYYIDIWDSAGKEVAGRIWVLDSGNTGCEGLTGWWSCIGKDTLDWVRDTAAVLPKVPSLAFTHIPLPQLIDLYNWYPTQGHKHESVTCPLGGEPGAFRILKDAGVQAVYHGHDHANDFVGELNGVRLAYGRKTGYGTYLNGLNGPIKAHGARVILLRQGEDAAKSETWIRNEHGEREDQVPTPPAEKTAFGNQQFCQFGDDKNQLMLEECLAGIQAGAFCEGYDGGLWKMLSKLNARLLDDDDAVTVLLPVLTNTHTFLAAAERQTVFTPEEKANAVLAYTLPYGQAAIKTLLDLERVPSATTAAGTHVFFEYDRANWDLFVRVEQPDRSFRRYRVLPYAWPSHSGKSVIFPLQKTIDEVDPTPDFVERVIANGTARSASRPSRANKLISRLNEQLPLS